LLGRLRHGLVVRWGKAGGKGVDSSGTSR
jgi:hypothetical protein